jgi:hypothetical protein
VVKCGVLFEVRTKFLNTRRLYLDDLRLQMVNVVIGIAAVNTNPGLLIGLPTGRPVA